MIETCRNCGARGTDAHHAIPKSICEAGRHELRNLILLCHSCHMGWHARSLTLYRGIFTDLELSWISAHASEGWLDLWYPERPNGDTPF